MNNDEKLAIQGGKPSVSRPMPEMYPGGMRIGVEEIAEGINKVLEAVI